MRTKAPVLRSNMIRLKSGPSGRRTPYDRKALYYCMAVGLMLALYVHDPDGMVSIARKARAGIGQVTSQLSPASFQAALLDLTQQ